VVKRLCNALTEHLFEELNLNLSQPLKAKRVKDELEFENQSVSNTRCNYMIYIPDSAEIDNANENDSEVRIRIELSFGIANKNTTIYETIYDRYVWGLFRILRNIVSFEDSGISHALRIYSVTEVKITNGDRFETEYYRPSIEALLSVYDDSVLVSGNAHKTNLINS